MFFKPFDLSCERILASLWKICRKVFPFVDDPAVFGPLENAVGFEETKQLQYLPRYPSRLLEKDRNEGGTDIRPEYALEITLYALFRERWKDNGKLLK